MWKRNRFIYGELGRAKSGGGVCSSATVLSTLNIWSRYTVSGRVLTILLSHFAFKIKSFVVVLVNPTHFVGFTQTATAGDHLPAAGTVAGNLFQ